MTTNNSAGKPYYTQRNNAIRPSGACTVTAMIAALSAACWPVESLGTEKYPQPEDALMNYILSDGAVAAAWKRLDPAQRFPPNEWHPLLEMGTNSWLEHAGLLRHGKKAAVWGEDRTLSDIADCIRHGGAAVLSGTFAQGGKTIGHVVAAVGCNCSDGGEVESLILDDSWGDYRDGYETANGNDIEMPAADFLRLIRQCGCRHKMAHLVQMFKEC
ncbi:MAG: hypothetical protein K2H09_07105 [Treponemataceae bacterium]|nr:hypothetical protein [Treponemataceae bacterium]